MKRKAKPRIAILREQAGITQLELSRLVGVTESTIQNWESGRTGTDHIERIIKFCKALNCKVEDLIEYVKEEESAKTATKKPSTLKEVQSLLGTDDNSQEKEVSTEESQVIPARKTRTKRS